MVFSVFASTVQEVDRSIRMRRRNIMKEENEPRYDPNCDIPSFR